MLALCMDLFSGEVRRTMLEGEIGWNVWKVIWSVRDPSQYQRTYTDNRMPEIPSLFLIRYMITYSEGSCVWTNEQCLRGTDG